MANWKLNPFGKKKGKVRPIWSDVNYNSNETLRLTADGLRNQRGYEYLQARRALLSSYQLRHDRGSLKEKLKKCGERLEELAKEIFLRIRYELSKKKVGVRVYRFTFAWPTESESESESMVRCFVPWLHDNQQNLIDA